MRSHLRYRSKHRCRSCSPSPSLGGGYSFTFPTFPKMTVDTAPQGLIQHPAPQGLIQQLEAKEEVVGEIQHICSSAMGLISDHIKHLQAKYRALKKGLDTANSIMMNPPSYQLTANPTAVEAAKQQDKQLQQFIDEYGGKAQIQATTKMLWESQKRKRSPSIFVVD